MDARLSEDFLRYDIPHELIDYACFQSAIRPDDGPYHRFWPTLSPAVSLCRQPLPQSVWVRS
jgi:hypothetical protein